ncbi:hypothetical protein [Pseudorhodoplanes sp.]|uniref:hypothetical protein n=1 Tax=Pseudorhodoplanes sp. TaxID=1934341 RepID=UPI00391B3196
MRDVILAAACAAAESDTVPAREPAEPLEKGNDVAVQLSEARSAGVTEGVRRGGLAERDRIKTILTGETAKGRESLAQYFAFETDFPAEVVLEALAKSPATKGGLDEAMAREAQPKLGAGGERPTNPPRVISTEDVYARRRAATTAAAKA